MSLNVEVLEQSFAKIKPLANEFAASFYENLFKAHPEMKPLFASTDMALQHKKLISSLVLVVENLRNPEALEPVLNALGARHISYGVIPKYYRPVGEALLKTFEQYLEGNWNPAVDKAWQDAYQAWSTVDAAHNVKVSYARILALQDLNEDGVSLRGLEAPNAELVDINLSHANLSKANLRESDLSNANLSYANLDNANLSQAKLSGANLSHAKLGFALLNQANLSSANLSNANLICVDLSNANLSGANLKDASLSGANLAGAYLSGANLKNAKVSDAELSNAFLEGAIMPDGSRYTAY